jgi:hypothetical protein
VTPLPPPQPPTSALAATFQSLAATTGQPLTTITVTFNRAVRGVTLDDFVLVWGRTTVARAFAGARLITTDRITYTLTNIRGTRLAGSFTLRLKATGTGIVDAANVPLAAPATVAWRMTRTVPAPLAAAVARA